MKIVLTTTYSNVDKEFLDWWLKHHGKHYGIPDDIGLGDVPFKHAIQNKDPTSDVIGTTIIEVINDPREREGDER